MSAKSQEEDNKNIITKEWKKLSNTWKTVIKFISILAGIITVYTPTTFDFFPSGFKIEYFLSVILVCILLAFLRYWRESIKEKRALENKIQELESEMQDIESENKALESYIQDLESELEEANGYSSLIDQKNTSPVIVNEKKMNVRIREDEKDEVEFNFDLSAVEGNEVNKYTALIGTDIDGTTYDDLNIDVENGDVACYRRRDFENIRRFVVEIDLYRTITYYDSYQLSFSMINDVLEPKNDYVYILIRENTTSTKMNIEFPEGWKPQRRISCGRGNLELKDLPDPDLRQNDNNRWELGWEYNDCVVGQSYKIDYTAEKTDQ
jgi:cell division protein FtsB